MKFDLNNPYILIEEETKGMLDEGGDVIDNAQISDMVVDRVGFKDDESALLILKQFVEQRHANVTPFIQSFQTLTMK